MIKTILTILVRLLFGPIGGRGAHGANGACRGRFSNFRATLFWTKHVEMGGYLTWYTQFQWIPMDYQWIISGLSLSSCSLFKWPSMGITYRQTPATHLGASDSSTHWCVVVALVPPASQFGASFECFVRCEVNSGKSYGKEPGWFNPCMDDLIHLWMIYLFNMVMMVMFHLDLDSWSLAGGSLEKSSSASRSVVSHELVVLGTQQQSSNSASIYKYTYIYIED